MLIRGLIFVGEACAGCAELKQSQKRGVSPSLLQKTQMTLSSLALMKVLHAFAAHIIGVLALTDGNIDF